MKKVIVPFIFLTLAAFLLPGSVAQTAPGGGVAVESTAGPNVVDCFFRAPKITGRSDETDQRSTTSTTHVDIAGAVVTANIGGQAATCVKVEFSAMAFAPGDNTLEYVRIIRNGVPCSPGETQFEANSHTFATSRAYNFLCANVPPGANTFQAQHRSLNGNTVFIHRATLFVHHR